MANINKKRKNTKKNSKANEKITKSNKKNIVTNVKKKVNKKRIKKVLKKVFAFLKKYIVIILLLIALLISIIYIYILSKREMITENVVLDQNIVFFGDSITNKYNLNEFYPNTYVVNSGISGDFSKDLVDRIEEDVYRYNPSKVFILIGINDLNHEHSKEEIVANIQKIINGIKRNRKNATIYVESIYPINTNVEDPFIDDLDTDEIIKTNKMIEELCKKNKINYLNLYNELADKDGNLKEIYTIDGVHLNDLGYFKVTMLLQKYVN